MHAATIRIILDDAQSHAQLARCRIYENPIRTYLAHTLTEVSEVCDAIEAASKEGFYIVFLGSYKLGEAFQGITQQDLETPLLKAWVFKDLKQINYDEMTAWLDAQKELEPAHIVPENRELDFQKFKSQIEKIQNYIRTGDTYQVNFTFREFGHIYGSPLQLFKNLRARQPVPFGAYVEDQDGYLISCSPEWFIKKTGAQLVTKPMKGTANRSSPLANHLADDPKNRAENLMIVDLLRNDLSKIALPGTVHVPKLFDIEEYGSVLQMTSTITAEIAPKTSLLKLLDAIFPCGSVTGAPKKRTMEIIQELENHPRKYYCGGLGYLDPSTDTMGDLCMSVLIRTLEVSPNQDYEFGVGSGITIDSDPLEEWQECQLKRKFLGSPPPWGVFETMRYENGEILRLNSHLIRLKNACEKLGITIDLENVKDQINKKDKEIDDYKTRLKLCENGNGAARGNDTALLGQRNRLADQVETLDIENENLKTQLAQMEEELNQLKEFKKGIEKGNEDGDIIINLTNMVATQKTSIEELEKKNKSLFSMRPRCLVYTLYLDGFIQRHRQSQHDLDQPICCLRTCLHCRSLAHTRTHTLLGGSKPSLFEGFWLARDLA